MTERSLNTITVIIALCAVLVTALVVRRELFSTPQLRSDVRDGTTVENWTTLINKERAVGASSPSVTVVEFTDYQCPFCAEAERRLGQLLDRYATDLEVTYRHFPLSIHPEAFKAAVASECAAEQGKFEAMHRVLFADQGSIGVRTWGAWARLAELPDSVSFLRCLEQEPAADRVRSDRAIGDSLGLSGTPAFIFGGRLYRGLSGIDALETLLGGEGLESGSTEGGRSESEGTLELDLSYREVGRIEHEFGSISSIAVAEDGRTFVGDDLAKSVWIFDPRHKMLGSIGKEGDGPGEFRDVTAIQVRADTLYVFDQRQRRLTVFDVSSGATNVMRTVSFRHARAPTEVWVDRDGSMIVRATSADATYGSGPGSDSSTVHRVWGPLVTSLGDTLAAMPRDESFVMSLSSMIMARPMPYGRRSFLRVGSHGELFTLWTGEPKIRTYDSRGTLSYDVLLPGHLGRDVSDEDFGELLASVSTEPGPLSSEFKKALEAARRDGSVPGSWPVASGVVIDDADRLWITLITERDVMRRTEAGGYEYVAPRGETRSLVVFQPEGLRFSAGRLPVAGNVGAVRGKRIYLVTADPLGVESIYVFEVEPTPV